MKKTSALIVAAVASFSLSAQTTPSDTIKAQFPGGKEKLSEYIETNRRYPQTALRNGIEGIVNVRFMVMSDGSLEQLSIVRLVDPDLEAEAIRLVKGMPVWSPASVKGKIIDSQSEVSVPFVLPE